MIKVGYFVGGGTGTSSGGGTGEGTLDHRLLDRASRSAANQHPISAIGTSGGTQLQDELNKLAIRDLNFQYANYDALRLANPRQANVIYITNDQKAYRWTTGNNYVELFQLPPQRDFTKDPINLATEVTGTITVEMLDMSNYYNKTETNTLLTNKADKSNTYTKTETNNLLSDKVDKTVLTSNLSEIGDKINELDSRKLDKLEAANTYYNKTTTDTLLSTKVNRTDIYTKTETNVLLGDKVDKEAGKGLSTNDYTTPEKEKLAGLESPNFKGSFTSEESFREKYPTGAEGESADVYIDDAFHRFVWSDELDDWEDKGPSGADSAEMVKQKYESNPDTNAFTDVEKAKLSILSDLPPVFYLDNETLYKARHLLLYNNALYAILFNFETGDKNLDEELKIALESNYIIEIVSKSVKKISMNSTNYSLEVMYSNDTMETIQLPVGSVFREASFNNNTYVLTLTRMDGTRRVVDLSVMLETVDEIDDLTADSVLVGVGALKKYIEKVIEELQIETVDLITDQTPGTAIPSVAAIRAALTITPF